MLVFLDIFLTVFHTAFMFFVMLGWAYHKTRKFHAIALFLTFVAWIFLGMYVGTIGYCPLTDWHWDIKRALGEHGMSSSFTGYLIENFLGLTLQKITYDVITAIGLIFGIGMSYVAYRKEKNRIVNA